MSSLVIVNSQNKRMSTNPNIQYMIIRFKHHFDILTHFYNYMSKICNQYHYGI
jgi:hypothetical protein